MNILFLLQDEDDATPSELREMLINKMNLVLGLGSDEECAIWMVEPASHSSSKGFPDGSGTFLALLLNIRDENLFFFLFCLNMYSYRY